MLCFVVYGVLFAIGIGLVIFGFSKRCDKKLRLAVVVLFVGGLSAGLGLAGILNATSGYGNNIIYNAELAVLDYEKGRMDDEDDYVEAVGNVGQYNRATREAKEKAGNVWNGKILEKFGNCDIIELPEGFYRDYVELLRKQEAGD